MEPSTATDPEPSTDPETSPASLCFRIHALRSSEDAKELLQKILHVARIFYMDDVELYFMEFHVDGPPGDNSCGPFSPRNELESLSSIIFALSSLRSDCKVLDCLKDEALKELESFANAKSDLYTPCSQEEERACLPMNSDSYVDDLMRWVVGKNVESKLRIADVSEGGKGLVASEDIQIGDVVLEIPMELVISDRYWEHEMLNKVQDSSCLTSEELLAWQVMKERDNSGSHFNLYFKTLPKELKTGLSFREDAHDALCGTQFDYMLDLKFDIKRMKKEFEELCRMFGEDSSFGSGKYTLEAYVQARELLYSYGIGALSDDGTRHTCLVPIAQFFNHSLFPHVLNCKWEINSLKFIASRHCGRGQQCYLSYGNFSGSELVAYYGFLPKGINHRDVIFLEPNFDGMFEELVHNKGDWIYDMVRVEESPDSPLDQKMRLSKATLIRLCGLIKTGLEVKEPSEQKKCAYTILDRFLYSHLRSIARSDRDWIRKHGVESEDEWDVELAMKYQCLVKNILFCGIYDCQAALRELSPEDCIEERYGFASEIMVL